MFITDQIEQFVIVPPSNSKSLCNKLYKLLFKVYILQETDHKCIYCSRLATTLDHIIPKCKGGQSLQSNLVGACEQCNKSKGTNYWNTWYTQQNFYNKQSEEYIYNKLSINKRITNRLPITN